MRSFRDVAALATAESFGRGAAWLTLFVLPWLLSADQYGIVVLINSFEGVAIGFLLLGQDRAVLWRYAGDTDFGDQTTVNTAVVVTAAACMIALSIGLVVASQSGGSLLGVPVWPHLVLIGVAVVLVNVNRIVLAFTRVARRTRDFVVNRAAVGSIRLAATLGLAVVTGSAVAYPVGLIVAMVGGGGWLWMRVLGMPRYRKSEFGALLRYGAPLSAHLLAMSSTRLVDRWIIGSMLGLATVGSYSWNYMLGSTVVFLFAALSVYYEPEIYREQQSDSDSRTALREYLGAAFAASGVYGLVGSAGAIAGRSLVPGSVTVDPVVIRIVLVAHWLHPVYYVCNYVLSSKGRTLPLAAVSAITLVSAVLANLLLVPILGAVGGAWATLISSVCLVLIAMLVLRRTGVEVSLGRPFLFTAGVSSFVIVTSGLWTLAAASALLALYGAYLMNLMPARGHRRGEGV